MSSSQTSFFSNEKVKNVFLHLRLPFSFFLLPVYIFALSQSISINIPYAVNVFISLHFFIYPASNAYNSYMDQDKKSIGALRNPPPAEKELYRVSLLLDIIGILMLSLISWKMIPLAMAYTAVSRLYSWTGSRLKKYAIPGWLTVILFQGAYTFMLVSMPAENLITWEWFTPQKIEAMLISTLLIGAYYPLTQIYQHEEDLERGDKTISLMLGIKGTFVFSALMFAIAFGVMYEYLNFYYNTKQFLVFIALLLPAVVYFLWWMIKTFKTTTSADYSNAMRMTVVSSSCLLIIFTIFLFMNHG